MIAILNGTEGSALDVFKGADSLIQATLLADGLTGPTGQVSRIGTPLDLTGDTTTLEVYDSVQRKNVATVSLPFTIVTAAAGQGTIAVSLANSNLLSPGVYYGYVKRSENTGTTIEFSRQFVTINVK
jgi:hypothetical protein